MCLIFADAGFVADIDGDSEEVGANTRDKTEEESPRSLSQNLDKCQMEQTDTKPYVCLFCQLAFASETELREHNQMEHETDDDEGSEMEDEAETPMGFANQSDEDSTCSSGTYNAENGKYLIDMKPLVCGQCCLTFTDAENYENHMETHEEESFVCSVCRTVFSSQETLNVHLESHTQATPLGLPVIPECAESTPHQGLGFLVHNAEQIEVGASHRFSEAAGEAQKNYCVVCRKSFVRKYDLKRHMMTHTNSKPFSCQLCSEKFRNKSGLAQHITTAHQMVTETDDGVRQCTTCGEKFLGYLLLLFCDDKTSFVTLKTTFSVDRKNERWVFCVMPLHSRMTG